MRSYLQEGRQPAVAWCEPDEEYDITDPAALHRMLEQHEPDWIVHLAAQSHVPTSWECPAQTIALNAGGTATLLQVLSEAGFKGRLLYVSSADVYGAVPEAELPVTEERAPAPRNPYASSKVAAEVLCRQWAITRPLDVVIARPFNHTGAGQRADFVLPSFARELARIRRRGGPAQLQAGDIDVTRDFLDVRDVVAAYLALLESGRTGEIYNVCSGREVLLKDALALLMQAAGVEAEVVTDASRLRPAEQRRMCGSHQKLTDTTGWQPRVAWRDTLAALVDHWMQERLE